jgi:hypothetical protein
VPRPLKGKMTSVSPASPEPAIKSETEYRDYLVEIFDIPKHLLRDSKRGEGVVLHYKKYQACLQAVSMADSMSNADEWESGIRKPSETEIVELFVGKTMWHSHYKRIFSRVPNYPQLQKWLKEDDDAPPTIDLWGQEKSHFTFKDLKDWMDAEDSRFNEKGKGKAKAEYKKGKGRVDDSGDSEDPNDDKKKKKKKKKKKEKKSKDREEGSSNKHHTRSKGKVE